MDKLAAGINFDGHGLAQSINAVQMQMNIMDIFAQNIVGFDKVGYQRKEAVVSSFAEYLGTGALSYSTDTQVGRIVITENPLDVALSEKGYFQVLNKDGSIELTRDGRFKLDKDGNLLTQNDQQVLSNGGNPIKFPCLPDELDKITIGLDGKIGVFDSKERGLVPVGTIGVVSEDGALVTSDCVHQGYIENSNVSIEREYIEIANHRRFLTANSTMFRIQNAKLSNTIQKLGSV
mgnify:FL=1